MADMSASRGVAVDLAVAGEAAVADETKLRRNGGQALGGAAAAWRGWVLELAVLNLAVATSQLWPSRLVAAILLAYLPGRLLLQAARVPAALVRRFPPYVVCASLALLTATTLAVDLVGPVLGDAAPLHRLPLLVAVDIVVVALGILGRNATSTYRTRRGTLVQRARWMWPLPLPVAAIAATARLDNGRGNTVALVVLVAVVAILAGGVFFAPRMNAQHLSMVIYGGGLATMLLTSMRSAYVVGYDISSEYFDLHQTVLSGVWHPGHLNADEAMLSLTVLPASLHSLIGGQDVWIFKLVYPALFAIFPVAVFFLASWVLSRRAAFLAAALLISQYYFFAQQPEIARQELALVVFAGLMGALLDRSLRKQQRALLVSMFAATLVVFHYSTTYVAIVICLSVVVAAMVLRRRRPRVAVAPYLLATVTLVAVAAIWYVPVTHSTSNLSFVVRTVEKQGIALLPGRRAGENVVSVYFNALREPPIALATFQHDVARSYHRYFPFLIPLRDAGQTKYSLRPASSVSVRGLAPFLQGPFDDAQLVIQQLLNGLGALGAVVLVLRRRRDPILGAIGYAGLGAIILLAASRLSGTLSTDYNSSRLWLQCYFLLAIAAVALIDLVARRVPASKLRRAAPGAFGVLLALAFIYNSGLAVPLVGGGPSLLLDNHSEDYSRLYVTAQERATVGFITATVPRTQFVYADDYGALFLEQFSSRRRGVFTVISPETVDRNAWVYATTANLIGRRTWGLLTAGPVEYEFPALFLNQNFDVVFSTGTTEVLHR